MKLCGKCSKLVLVDRWPNSLVFHENLQALVDSAKNCAFCNLCWVQIQRDWTFDVIQSCLNPEPDAETRIHITGELQHGSTAAGIWLSVGELPRVAGELANGPATRLDIFTEPATPADAVFNGRYITPDRNANLLIEETKRWLSICRERHVICNRVGRSSGPKQMPKRLIYTGDSTSPPRLVLSENLPVLQPYLALSYCWGTGVRDAIELRDHNLASLLLYLPESQLTKTHQEAIHLTRALNFSYLWIDSLCIIQGNPADWESESKRMATVYSGAELTIIAARAADSRDGFLVNNTYASFPPPVPMPFGPNPRTGSGDLGTVYLTLSRDLRVSIDPVDSHAWCYQETVLSTRALCFTAGQVKFRCRFATFREDGGVELVEEQGDWAFRLGGPEPGSKGEVLRRWYCMITRFSQRNLTEPHDIFACVASIALIVGRVVRGRYLAGLWEEDMARGLMWRAWYNARPRWRLTPLTRPKASGFRKGEVKGEPITRAPSWSWAGLQGPVLWAHQERKQRMYTEESNRCVRPRREGGWTGREDVGEPDRLYMPELELQLWGKPLRVRCLKVTPREYVASLPSADERRWWDMKYPLQGVLLWEFSADSSPADENSSSVEFVGIGYFDIPDDGVPAELYCLRVVKEEGLIVARDEDGKFRRVGMFFVTDNKPFEGVNEVHVDLI